MVHGIRHQMLILAKDLDDVNKIIDKVIELEKSDIKLEEFKKKIHNFGAIYGYVNGWEVNENYSKREISEIKLPKNFRIENK